MTALRGALFDMDGLLLDTERLAQKSFIEVTAPYRLAASQAEAIFLTMVGSSGAQSWKLLAPHLPEGADLDALDRAWSASFTRLAQQGIDLRPTAAEAVHALAAQGVPMAVVTSSKRAQAEDHLTQTGLRQYFAGIIGAGDVTRHKPAPDPYLAGAALLGLNPEDCAAFEDSDKGTRAALAAGCAVWQIPDLRPPDVPIADLGQSQAKTLLAAVRDAGFL